VVVKEVESRDSKAKEASPVLVEATFHKAVFTSLSTLDFFSRFM